MTIREIKLLRKNLNVRILEVAAMSGLPAGLIEQIEAEQIVALESDLERIHHALKEIEHAREILSDE